MTGVIRKYPVREIRGIHKEIAKKETLVVKEMCKDFTPEQMEAFLQMTEMMLQNIS